MRLGQLPPEAAPCLEVSYTFPGWVSAGLTVRLRVTFTPREDRDLDTYLPVVTRAGPVRVPVRARRRRAAVSVAAWPAGGWHDVEGPPDRDGALGSRGNGRAIGLRKAPTEAEAAAEAEVGGPARLPTPAAVLLLTHCTLGGEALGTLRVTNRGALPVDFRVSATGVDPRDLRPASAAQSKLLVTLRQREADAARREAAEAAGEAERLMAEARGAEAAAGGAGRTPAAVRAARAATDAAVAAERAADQARQTSQALYAAGQACAGASLPSGPPPVPEGAAESAAALRHLGLFLHPWRGTVPPRGEILVRVAFVPAAVGRAAAALRLSMQTVGVPDVPDRAPTLPGEAPGPAPPCPPVDVAVVCQSVDVPLAVRPAKLDLGCLVHGEPYKEELVLCNDGPVPARCSLKVPRRLRPYLVCKPAVGYVQPGSSFGFSLTLKPTADLLNDLEGVPGARVKRRLPDWAAGAGDGGTHAGIGDDDSDVAYGDGPDRGIVFGSFDVPLRVHAPDQALPATCVLSGSVTSPELELDPPSLDFGIVPPGEATSLGLTLRSRCALPIRYGFVGLREGLAVDDGNDGFGTIPPGGRRTVRVCFTPPRAGALRFPLDLRTLLGTHVQVPCRARCVALPLAFDCNRLTLPAVEVGRFATASVILRHSTLTAPPVGADPVEGGGEDDDAARRALDARPGAREEAEAALAALRPARFHLAPPLDSRIRVQPNVGEIPVGGCARLEVSYHPRPSDFPELAGRDEDVARGRGGNPPQRIPSAVAPTAAEGEGGEGVKDEQEGEDGEDGGGGDEAADAHRMSFVAAATHVTDAIAGGAVFEKDRQWLRRGGAAIACYVCSVPPRKPDPNAPIVRGAAAVGPENAPWPEPEPGAPPARAIHLEVITAAVLPSLVVQGAASRWSPKDAHYKVDFGDVALGERVIRTVTLAHAGSLSGGRPGPLAPAASPLHPRETFAVVNRCRPIEPGRSQTLSLAFCPGAAGRHREVLEITDREHRSSLQIALTGTGVSPSFGVSVDKLDLGDVLRGDTATRRFDVRNDSPFVLRYTLLVVDCPHTNVGGTPVFVVKPAGGSIAPGASQTVEVTFLPDHEHAGFRGRLLVSVPNQQGDVAVRLTGRAWDHGAYLIGMDVTDAIEDPFKSKQLSGAGAFALTTRARPAVPVTLTFPEEVLPGSSASGALEVGNLGPPGAEAGGASGGAGKGDEALFSVTPGEGALAAGWSAVPLEGKVESGARGKIVFSFECPADPSKLNLAYLDMGGWIEATFDVSIGGGTPAWPGGGGPAGVPGQTYRVKLRCYIRPGKRKKGGKRELRFKAASKSK